MKFFAVRLRMSISPPEMPIDGQSRVHDVFKSPEYHCEDAGSWVRIRHVETGKQRLVPQSWVCCADPVDEQPQGQQPQKHGGKR